MRVRLHLAAAQVWPRLVTLTGAGRRVTAAACHQSEVSRAVVRTWVIALPPVTSHHHSDNRDQSAETRDTNTQPQKWVTQWSSVCRLIIPTVVKSKAVLKISDQEEIFIVNLTNFSSIDQIGSPVITFFRPPILWHLTETRWIFPNYFEPQFEDSPVALNIAGQTRTIAGLGYLLWFYCSELNARRLAITQVSRWGFKL